ncbi:MAG: hypothetical protein HY466_07355 [Deltaproteobacteria bacterium]|nr:hypothetical protein [Deltaproteobacteria bacterium]
MFIVKTGNHHLFLILKTLSGEEWIVLLGKRKIHFPFYGTRFENATFYNVKKQKLHHFAAEEMKDLIFETKAHWRLSGKTPVDFSLEFVPNPLAKRTLALGMVKFQYHTLRLVSGRIGSEVLKTGHGVSEQGRLITSTFKKLQVPFCYSLLLAADGQGGRIDWKADPKQTFFGLRFLKDRLQWGGLFEPKATETLVQTRVPLKGWVLHREIVKGAQAGRTAYGLKESFDWKGVV